MSDDGELIKRLEAGDAAAAEVFVERYYADILRYCLWHVPSPALAEDAAQETFLKFLRYLGRYQHRGRCRAFLYQIARHTCIDMARQRHGRRPRWRQHQNVRQATPLWPNGKPPGSCAKWWPHCRKRNVKLCCCVLARI